MAEWVRVEFYGRLPDPPAMIEELDVLAVGNTVGRAFGFTHIDGLTLERNVHGGCDCLCHCVIQPGLIPCPKCEHSSRSVAPWRDT